jgi:twitching motility protein PilT
VPIPLRMSESVEMTRTLLRTVVASQASDLHIRAGHAPAMRVDGRLQPAGPDVVTADDVDAIASWLMPEPRRREFAGSGETDFAYDLSRVGRFRVNVFKQRGTTALVMRLIPGTIPALHELGLPPVVEHLADQRDGLVLVTGRAGAGKTTTLASMIDRINATRDGHVLTIEDPIEYVHTNKRCVISQREVGVDTADFRTALRRLLRQDPDVILIGEMRDPETVWAAISAAETGHLVLSTLHTVTAVETVHRILDLFPSEQHAEVRSSLAANLRGIVSLRLLPRAEGKGRVPATEVLIGTGRVFDRIAAPDRTYELEEVISEGDYYGMRSFDQSLVQLYREGTITRQVALGAATRRHDLQLWLDRLDSQRASVASTVT